MVKRVFDRDIFKTTITDKSDYVVIEHEGKTYTADLYGVYEDDYNMRGYFEFRGKEYRLTKELKLAPDGATVLDISIKEVGPEVAPQGER